MTSQPRFPRHLLSFDAVIVLKLAKYLKIFIYKKLLNRHIFYFFQQKKTIYALKIHKCIPFTRLDILNRSNLFLFI